MVNQPVVTAVYLFIRLTSGLILLAYSVFTQALARERDDLTIQLRSPIFERTLKVVVEGKSTVFLIFYCCRGNDLNVLSIR